MTIKSENHYKGDFDYNIKEYHIRYALNLIDVYELSENFIKFILSLLGLNRRKEMIESLYVNRVPQEDENGDFDFDNHYYDIIDNFVDAQQISDYITIDIYNGQLEHDTEKVICIIGEYLNWELNLLPRTLQHHLYADSSLLYHQL